MMRTWLRRNGRSLLALPFLLALAMAANGQRAVDYWWPSEPRDRVEVGADGYVRLSEPLRDGNGEHPRALRIRVVDTAAVTTREDYPGATAEELDVPDELRVWRVTMHLQVDPATVVGACTLTVLDAQGREYRPGTSVVDGNGDGAYACVPPDDPGPELAIVAGPVRNDPGLDDDDAARPPEYDRYVYVVMPADREPDRLRVVLQTPRYAEFDLTP